MARRQSSAVYLASQKRTLRECLKGLRHRDSAIQDALKDIQDVGSKLEFERTEILHSIDKSVEEIRSSLNEIVDRIQTELEERHQRNLEILNKHEASVVHRLAACRQDITKCEDLLTNSITSEELKVNKMKVFDMVTGSVEKNKFTPPHLELHRMKLEKTAVTNDIQKNIEQLIGTFTQCRESLGEIQHPVSLLKSFQIPNTEVNAIALNSIDKKTKSWMSCGVSNELVCYNESGVRERTITMDFEINDVAVSDDGRIYVTSPDSHVWRCLKLTRSGGFVQLFTVKDELHIHAVTMCRNNTTLAVCGTDRANYSSQHPNEVVIITYSMDGDEIKRLAISNYSGKVYRLAQNYNDNFVLTFPKEGAVMSVDNLTGEIKSFFDKKDFRLFVSTHLRVVNSNDFWPTGVCCDTHANIYVTEYLEKLLLMLDPNCSILRYIGGRYNSPNAVSFQTHSNTLWVADKRKLQVWTIHNTPELDQETIQRLG